MSADLHGYRVRVTVDYPVWCIDEEQAIEYAKEIAMLSHTAGKVISTKVIKSGPADNLFLMTDDPPRKIRIGMEPDDAIALCKLGGGGNVCVGVGCGGSDRRYWKCWEQENPDEEGFIEAEFKVLQGGTT